MGWISVNDRLPEKDKDVLVFVDNLYIKIAWIDTVNENGTFWLYDIQGYYDEGSIEYWMPLPKPPNAKDS